MAEHLRQQGVQTRSIPGRGIVSFRMYPGPFSDLVEGWTKAIASGAGKTDPLVMVCVIAWMSALMMAFLGLLLSGFALKWGFVYLIGAASVGFFSQSAGRFRPITPLLYPIPLLAFFVLFARSSVKGNRSVTWKGRTIHES
jgi:4,4'-diaponeurosporenoate glycosyltransferase